MKKVPGRGPPSDTLTLGSKGRGRNLASPTNRFTPIPKRPNVAEKKRREKEELKEMKEKEKREKKERQEETGVSSRGVFIRSILATLNKIWSTRALQELHNFDKHAFLRTYLLEFVIFILFIVVVIIVMLGLRPIDAFYVCNAIKTVFFETPLDNKGKHMITFKTISTKQQYWQYMQTNFLDGMFGKPLTTPTVKHLMLEQNILHGQARLRQLRVRNGSCELPDILKNKVYSCFGAYSDRNEDTQELYTSIGKTYIDYTYSSYLKYSGLLASYDNSGFYVTLESSKSRLLRQFEALNNENWIDRGTRAVLLDFIIYNPSIQTFVTVTMVAEFSMTGGVFTSYQIQTMRLAEFSHESFTFYVLFVLFGFICYYIAEEIIELLVLRELYYKRVAALIDNVIIVTGICILIIMAIATTRHGTIMEEVFKSQNYHQNVMYMAEVQKLADVILALHVFFVFIKLFTYLEINQTMYKLMHTIYAARSDLLGFSILFFFVILSFALLGMLLFGYQLTIFSSLTHSIVALFRILLGDIEFEYIDDKHSVIGAIYLILFIVSIYFILINVFLAIIFHYYNQVKDDVGKRKHDFYLTDYIKNKFVKSKRNSIMGTTKKRCSQWVNEMLYPPLDKLKDMDMKSGYANEWIEEIMKKHKRQGLKLDSMLSDHQVKTLTYELDEIKKRFKYENIAQLEKMHQDFDDDMQIVLAEMTKRQNAHKLAMLKLLDMIKKSKQTNDVKVNSIYNLIKNELSF